MIKLTHLHPREISSLAAESRELGARIVVVHGETVAEPVMAGTNRAALEADIDILAHPGLIAGEDAALAAERSILLEISARKGHSLTNGHVAQQARKHGAGLVLNTDSHSPGDLIGREYARIVARGAGLTESEIDAMFRNAQRLIDTIDGAA